MSALMGCIFAGNASEKSRQNWDLKNTTKMKKIKFLACQKIGGGFF